MVWFRSNNSYRPEFIKIRNAGENPGRQILDLAALEIVSAAPVAPGSATLASVVGGDLATNFYHKLYLMTPFHHIQGMEEIQQIAGLGNIFVLDLNIFI